MPESRGNGLPAYKRIQGAILKRLESGQLKPGDAVNSERELAKIHRVSLMTARHALAGLESEGMVVDLLRTHPKLLLGGLLLDNPNYMSPEEYRAARADNAR